MPYSAHVSALRRVGLLVALVGVVVSCASDPADPLPLGVLLMVESDLTGAPADQVFAAIPELLVTVDGDVIYGAPSELAIQGELVPDVWVQPLSAAGIEMVRQAVADGSAPTSPVDLQDLVGAELGSMQFYLPDAYRLRAVELVAVSEFDDPDTPLIPWPDTVSVSLAAAAECIRLPEIEVGEVFETAAADSVFADDGVVYGVVVAQDWPGAPC